MFNIFGRVNRTTFSYDQAVIITIPFNNFDDFGTKEDRHEVEKLEKQIEEVLPENSGVDGHEFGDNECVIYSYGPSADAIWEKTEPILKRSAFNHIDVSL